MGLNAERRRVADALTAAGVPRVTLDPRNVNPPCVLVGVPITVGRTTVCARAGRVEVAVIAPPPGNLDAVTAMLDVADLVVGAVDVVDEPGAGLVEVGDVLAPAYTLNVAVYP